MNTGRNDYYAILGVPRDATQAEVREQYRKLWRMEEAGQVGLEQLLGQPDDGRVHWRRTGCDAEADAPADP